MTEQFPFPWYVLAKTEGGDRVMRLIALNSEFHTARYRCDIHDLEVDAKWQAGHLIVASEDWVDSIYDIWQYAQEKYPTYPIHSLNEISYREWKDRTSASPRHFIADIDDWNDLQAYPNWQEDYTVSNYRIYPHTKQLNGRPGYDLGDRVSSLAQDNLPYAAQVYQSICRFNTSVPWESPTLWIKLTIFGYGTVFDSKTAPLIGASDLLAELRMRVDSFRLS